MQNIRLIWQMEVDDVVHPDPLTHIHLLVLEVLTWQFFLDMFARKENK